MPPTALITGGRAPLALEWARLLHGAGWRVVSAESLRPNLLEASATVSARYGVPEPREHPEAFVGALEAIVRAEGVAWVIPTCEEVFMIGWGRERLEAAGARVLAPSLTALDVLHHKGRFAAHARALGLAVPETEVLESRAALSTRLAAKPAGEAWILKAAYSRFGNGVRRVSSGEPLPPDVRPTPEEPWLLQRAVPGRVRCAYALVREGRLAAFCDYASEWKAGEASIAFEYQGHPGVRAWVEHFVESASGDMQLSFDFIETPEGEVFALECNPRTTSGIHLFARSPRFAGLLEAAPEAPLAPAPGTQVAVKAAMVLYGLPAVLREPRRFGAWRRAVAGLDAIHRPDDPGPAKAQLRVYAALMARALRLRMSVLEASTHDIEWNGAWPSSSPARPAS